MNVATRTRYACVSHLYVKMKYCILFVIIIIAYQQLIIRKKTNLIHAKDFDIYKLNEIAADFEHWIVQDEIDIISRYSKTGNKCVVLVYGTGYLGRSIIDIIKRNDQIDVKYIIDRQNSSNTIRIEDVKDLSDVDLAIVTPIMEYGNIKKELENRGCKEIVSIETLIWMNVNEK